MAGARLPSAARPASGSSREGPRPARPSAAAVRRGSAQGQPATCKRRRQAGRLGGVSVPGGAARESGGKRAGKVEGLTEDLFWGRTAMRGGRRCSSVLGVELGGAGCSGGRKMANSGRFGWEELG
jgi:hypothetical protein